MRNKHRNERTLNETGKERNKGSGTTQRAHSTSMDINENDYRKKNRERKSRKTKQKQKERGHKLYEITCVHKTLKRVTHLVRQIWQQFCVSSDPAQIYVILSVAWKKRHTSAHTPVDLVIITSYWAWQGETFLHVKTQKWWIKQFMKGLWGVVLAACTARRGQGCKMGRGKVAGSGSETHYRNGQWLAVLR